MTDRHRYIGIVLLIALLVYSRSSGALPFVPQPGQRTVVILHESAQSAPWFGELAVDLQRKGGTAQAYLTGQGHSLYILDDDLPNKWQLAPKQVPALFILDANGKVLFEQAIPANYTADQIVERLRETGG